MYKYMTTHYDYWSLEYVLYCSLLLDYYLHRTMGLNGILFYSPYNYSRGTMVDIPFKLSACL